MKIIQCCGQDNRSPFCSLCGKRLQEFPLTDLLIHCRDQADKAETIIRDIVAASGSSAVLQSIPGIRVLIARLGLPAGGGIAFGSKERDRLTKAMEVAEKWRSWTTALESMMKYASSLPDAERVPDAGTRNLEV